MTYHLRALLLVVDYRGHIKMSRPQVCFVICIELLHTYINSCLWQTLDVPLSNDAKLSWAGYSRQGSLCVADSNGMLRQLLALLSMLYCCRTDLSLQRSALDADFRCALRVQKSERSSLDIRYQRELRSAVQCNTHALPTSILTGITDGGTMRAS